MSKVIIPNDSFISLLNDKEQVVIIDANIIIPPDRSMIRTKSGRKLTVPFTIYSEKFIEPLLNYFPNVSIHESVYEEVTNAIEIKTYVDEKIASGKIKLLEDSSLSNNETMIRNTVESNISQYTNYSPSIDNRKDRGEVKSLSYAVAKNLIYFSTNDSNVISLIDRVELQGILHSVGSIKIYEIIYLINSINSSKVLRSLYKLLYYLTDKEKSYNSDWSSFKQACDEHYKSLIS